MNGWLKSILDFVYPSRCMVCGEWEETEDSVCPECCGAFDRIGHPMCTVCGKPFESSPSDHKCGACSIKKPPYDMLRSVGKYEGSLREAVLRFKFNQRTSLAKKLGEMAAEVVNTEYESIDIDSIVPVPLHPTRLRWRGFNQSMLLSRHIGSRNKIWVDAYSLRRVRDTTPQVQLTPKQRDFNVRGAFAISKSQFVDGRKILLVDDVATTCATLRECAKVLRKNGAAAVYTLTIARAGP